MFTTAVGFRVVTISQVSPSSYTGAQRGAPAAANIRLCCLLPRLKAARSILTCNQAGDDERENQHLEHTHQQLAREGEILDLAIGQLVGPEGKCQDDPCGSARDENGNGTVRSSGLSLSPTAWLFSFSAPLSSSPLRPPSPGSKCSF